MIRLFRFSILAVMVMSIVLLVPSVLLAEQGEEPLFLEENEITKKLEYVPSDFKVHFIGSLLLNNLFKENLIVFNLGFSVEVDYFYIEILLDLEERSYVENPYGNESSKFGTLYRNWTSIRQLIGKIQKMSYGVYNVTNIFAFMGEIHNFSAGPGTIMKNYTNSIQSPIIKGIGLHLAVDYDFIGGEAMLADIITPDLFGSYIYVKPLQFFKDWGIYRDLEVGFTFCVDFNPYEISYYVEYYEPYVNNTNTDIDGNVLPPVINENLEIVINTDSEDIPTIDSIYGWSIYGKFPVWDFPFINFNVLLEYAYEKDLGSCFRFGVNGKIFNGSLNYRIEFLAYERGFIPSFFFSQYDNYKINRFIRGIERSSSGTPFGIFVELGKDIIPNRLGFFISFEDYFDDNYYNTNKLGYEPIDGEMSIRFYLKEFVKGLGIEIMINKWDLGYESFRNFFNDTANTTMWYFKFYWWVTPNAQFSLSTQKTFRYYVPPLSVKPGERSSVIYRLHTFTFSTLIYI